MIPRFWRVPLAAGTVTAVSLFAALAAAPSASARPATPGAESRQIAARASAGGYATINGSGSSWAALALDQWAQDLRPSGLVANYNPDGSAAGRGDYEANQDDYSGSDPPFRNGHDELGGTGAEHPTQGYSYVPDTAGGTAFMYHIEVAGHLVTNLRLSGKTIMEIFTGAITNWDDPRITHDYGAQLPNLPITPVIRSDGSGATFFFTRWMAHVFPQQWNAFCQKEASVIHHHISLPCPQTEFYPLFGNAKSENGSNNVATYITASYGNGAIGYDEYAYALNAHYPVVEVLNAAGYYVLPTPSNVAVALTKAVITETPGPNFLQQDLDAVYTYTDPRSYPLSSYSYLIVPRDHTTLPSNFTPAKGRSLSTYINFLLCAGQNEVAALGYSPLPLNLVEGGLLQNSHIPGHVPIPNLSNGSCKNPTFTNGVLTLLKTAPEPSPCAKVGSPLTGVVVNGKCEKPGPNSQPSSGPSSGPSGGPSTGPSGPSSPGANPLPTGSQPSGGGTPAPVVGVVVNVASSSPNKVLLSTITAAAIILAVVMPPLLGGWLRRRKRQAPGVSR
ncbi:MAG TPA: substrate-binding domain-containing protein [Streptosporangiaceae bacterium]|nr:substrate-binding domain-containing protein [Streptosporangiaceae bacterium]